MKKLYVKVDPCTLVLSGSVRGKKWSEENHLSLINDEILIVVDDNIEIIAIAFYQGILESLLGKRDKERIKTNIKFKNSKYQREFINTIKF